MKYLILGLLLFSQSSFAIIGGESLANFNDGIVFVGTVKSGCTATKVGVKTLITAAHCLNNNSIDSFRFLTREGWKELKIKETWIHPSFAEVMEDNEPYMVALYALDVALIEVIPNEIFEKLPIVELDFTSTQAEDEVSFVGFGCQKSINDKIPFIPTKKISITQIAPKELMQTDHGHPTYNQLLIERRQDPEFTQILTYGQRSPKKHGSLCLGDSGGPLLKNQKVIGINSSYTFNDVTPEGRSASGISFLNFHTRLELAKDWLLSHIQ